MGCDCTGESVIEVSLCTLPPTSHSHIQSTFFNTLTGSASGYGTIAGRVFINEEEKPLTHYKDVIGFVPQVNIGV